MFIYYNEIIETQCIDIRFTRKVIQQRNFISAEEKHMWIFHIP